MNKSVTDMAIDESVDLYLREIDRYLSVVKNILSIESDKDQLNTDNEWVLLCKAQKIVTSKKMVEIPNMLYEAFSTVSDMFKILIPSNEAFERFKLYTIATAGRESSLLKNNKDHKILLDSSQKIHNIDLFISSYNLLATQYLLSIVKYGTVTFTIEKLVIKEPLSLKRLKQHRFKSRALLYSGFIGLGFTVFGVLPYLAFPFLIGSVIWFILERYYLAAKELGKIKKEGALLKEIYQNANKVKIGVMLIKAFIRELNFLIKLWPQSVTECFNDLNRDQYVSPSKIALGVNEAQRATLEMIRLYDLWNFDPTTNNVTDIMKRIGELDKIAATME